MKQSSLCMHIHESVSQNSYESTFDPLLVGLMNNITLLYFLRKIEFLNLKLYAKYVIKR